MMDLIQDKRYLNAIHLFNSHQWYAAHDAFEDLWHDSTGQNRSLLQGIIQVAVAEYHLENDNLRGALLLMSEGRKHLLEYGEGACGFDLPTILATVSDRLWALQSGLSLENIPLPSLDGMQDGDLATVY